MVNLIIQGAIILSLIVGGVVCLAIGQAAWGERLLGAGLIYAAALVQNRPALPSSNSPPATGSAAPMSSGPVDPTQI